MISGSSISRRIRGRSTYKIPRGEDEYSSLVSQRTGSTAPSVTNLYQNDSPELFVNYGTVPSSHMIKIHKTDE